MPEVPSADFIAVANVSDLADPDSMLVEVDGRMLVLIHAAGHFYALDDLCTHDGGPLSGGRVDAVGGALVCPRHGARFEFSSGNLNLVDFFININAQRIDGFVIKNIHPVRLAQFKG